MVTPYMLSSVEHLKIGNGIVPLVLVFVVDVHVPG